MKTIWLHSLELPCHLILYTVYVSNKISDVSCSTLSTKAVNGIISVELTALTQSFIGGKKATFLFASSVSQTNLHWMNVSEKRGLSFRGK